MTETGQVITGYANQLEPHALIDNFLLHPPAGFDSNLSEQGVPYFITRFDLLTTADDDLRNKLRQWPGYRWWGKWLQINTGFVGTTVSEYALIPHELASASLIDWIQHLGLGHKKLSIIKDLPVNSPLLSAEDNARSQELISFSEQQGFFLLEGQALAYVEIDFTSIDDFLARMSHSRRRNLRRKLRSREALRIEVIETGDHRFCDAIWLDRLYRLYLAVYKQSGIHFDLLEPEFFTGLLQDANSSGRLFCYWQEDTLVGWNLCYQYDGKLIDKYIGLNYPLALTHNLYFVSWFVNLEYAIEQGLSFYIAGWTDHQVKASLGASFSLTYHLVWVRNPLLRNLLKRYRHHFEGDAISEALPL